jgi:hypothetical protein
MGGAIPPTSTCTKVHVTTRHNKLQSKLITKNKEDIKMRTPSVTRTISTLNITVLGMDTDSRQPVTKTYPVYESDAPKDEAKLFNYIRKMYETNNFKISAITGKKAVTKTYTMPLSKYIAEAEEVIKGKAVDETKAQDTAQ